jgi:hypothetical protein
MGIELSMTLVLPYSLAIRASKLNHANTMPIILFIAIIRKSVAVKIVGRLSITNEKECTEARVKMHGGNIPFAAPWWSWPMR